MDEETRRTREVVERYHQCWMALDVDGVMALYHPDIEYYDFFNNLRIPFDALRDYRTARSNTSNTPTASASTATPRSSSTARG